MSLAATEQNERTGPETTPWVFDADGHIVEPLEMWGERLPARYSSYAPSVLQFEDHFRFVCNDRISFRIPGRVESCAAPGQTPHKMPMPVVADGATDPTARLCDMDLDGIEIAALYPTYGLMVQGVTEPDAATALCRAVNDWIADYCAADPSRLIGVGLVPQTGPEEALAEARRCVEEHGFRGVWRRPEQFSGITPIQDPAYDAVWGYLAEAGVPIAFHPGVNGLIPYEYLADRFDDYYSAIHAAHFVTEQMMALTSMVAYGVLERFPTLRVAFLECGASWTVSYLHRLDEHLDMFGFERADLTMRPSEYFRRQCFVSAEEVEPGLDTMVELYPESVVFASDYPHADGTFPGATAELLQTDELDRAAVRSIMRTNADVLYGLTD